MKTADKVSRELRRFGRQLVNVKNHGCFNPYTRMRRPNRPEAIQENPGWEIESPLEFIASHVAHRRGNFRFVQIGAFDGIQYDSLPQLAIKNQWRGILVEPQPAAFELLSQSCAQHDCFDLANVAIGEQQGELDFYTTVDAPSNLASFDRQHLLRFGLPEEKILTIRVKIETLESLLQKYGYDHIHLLQVDTEGFDGAIIRSINFDVVKPEIIRYEHLNMVESERSELVRMLASLGYRFIFEDNDTIAYIDVP